MRFCRLFLANAGLLLLLCHVEGVDTDQCAIQRAHDKRLELCRFVLQLDHQWSLVLAQPVKLTADNRAPYDADELINADVRARLRVAGPDAEAVTPLNVLQKVMGELSWFGSYVDYAVQVLSKALTCIVHMQLTKVIELLEALEGQHQVVKQAVEESKRSESPEDDDDGGVHDRTVDDVAPFRASYHEAWLATAMLANHLAVVGGNLQPMRDMLNLLSRALVEGEQVSYPVIKLMRIEIDKKIDGMCERQELWRVNLQRTSEEPELSISRFSRRLFKIYGSMEVEALRMETWSQVFNYQLPNKKSLTLDTIIDELLRNDKLRGKYERMLRKFELKLLEDFARRRNEGKDLSEDEDEDRVLRFE